MKKRKNTYIHERTKFVFTEISVERNVSAKLETEHHENERIKKMKKLIDNV